MSICPGSCGLDATTKESQADIGLLRVIFERGLDPWNLELWNLGLFLAIIVIYLAHANVLFLDSKRP
jgi:hypothetical protein